MSSIFYIFINFFDLTYLKNIFLNWCKKYIDMVLLCCNGKISKKTSAKMNEIKYDSIKKSNHYGLIFYGADEGT